MKAMTVAAIGLLALCSGAAGAQEEDAAMGEIIVTGAWRGDGRGAVIAAPKPGRSRKVREEVPADDDEPDEPAQE